MKKKKYWTRKSRVSIFFKRKGKEYNTKSKENITKKSTRKRDIFPVKTAILKIMTRLLIRKLFMTTYLLYSSRGLCDVLNDAENISRDSPRYRARTSRDGKNTSTYEKIIRVSCERRVTSTTPRTTKEDPLYRFGGFLKIAILTKIYMRRQRPRENAVRCACPPDRTSRLTESRFPLTGDTRARFRRAASARREVVSRAADAR